MKHFEFLHDREIQLSSNTYIICDDDNNAVVIDPSVTNTEIVDFINEHHLVLKGILLTHGHFDHIRGINILVKAFNCPLYVSSLDKPLLTNCIYNCSSSYRINVGITVKYEPILFNDGDIINVINTPIKVIATPYHTEGSVCFYLEKEGILYSGDSLFKLFLGRDNLPTSCPAKRNESLNKLMILPDETLVYPGHGLDTTIGMERKRIQRL